MFLKMLPYVTMYLKSFHACHILWRVSVSIAVCVQMWLFLLLLSYVPWELPCRQF